MDPELWSQLPDIVRGFVHFVAHKPRINSQVVITGYHKLFGITGGDVDATGYAVPLPDNERKNGFERDQVQYFAKDFIIIRNEAGRGGTPGALNGESGGMVDRDGARNFKSHRGSMSYRHEFIMPLDTSFWWCNAAYFGQGPGKYAPKGTYKMLTKMKQVANEWAVKHGVKNPFFGFHEFPHNSLFHLHLHLIDLDRINDKDEGSILPGYIANFEKTTPLDYYIDKMAQRVQQDEDAFTLSPIPSKDIFWIIGAPTQVACVTLQNAYKRNHSLEIVFCASLSTYMKEIGNEEKPDIYKLPTNCRSHHAGGVQINTTYVHDLASYKVSQKEISTSLAQIFNFSQANSVPFYFACPPRNLRPAYIRQNKNTRKVYADSNPELTSQEKDQEDKNLRLSNLILKNAFIPAFKGADNLERIMEKTLEYGATYGADVLTVGCALILDNPSCWQRFGLDTPAIVSDNGVFHRIPDYKPAKVTGVIPPNSTDIPYVDAHFSDVQGYFRSFADDRASIGKVKEKITTVLNKLHLKGEKKLWGTSTIFHDAGLNDIDDEPAIYLIRSLSHTIVKIQNYSLPK